MEQHQIILEPVVYNVHLPIMLESERQAVYRERKKGVCHIIKTHDISGVT